jgi:hypothetical protein
MRSKPTLERWRGATFRRVMAISSEQHGDEFFIAPEAGDEAGPKAASEK